MIKQISLVNRSGHTLRGILNFPEEKEIAPVLINLHGFGGTMGGYKGLHTRHNDDFKRLGLSCLLWW